MARGVSGSRSRGGVLVRRSSSRAPRESPSGEKACQAVVIESRRSKTMICARTSHADYQRCLPPELRR